MKFKQLRAFLRSKQLNKDYYIQYGMVVIDAKSYFNELCYGKSGCQYIFGAECDRYANYIKSKLYYFLDCNITCYVIFNGGMKADMETRRAIHEKIIKNRDAINQENYKTGTYDPIFVKDVHKGVLDELGIKYFCCEYDSRADIVSVAKQMGCPVITNNIEYCLYGVSCITTNSIVYEKKNKRLVCSIYSHEICRNVISIRDDLIPIFLTLVDEDYKHFNNLPEIIPSRQHNLIPSVRRWVRRQTKEITMNTILKNLENEVIRQKFLDSCKEKVGRHPWKSMAVKYFNQRKPYSLFKNDEKWFLKGVSNGRIATPYVNLKNMALFSGSWQIYDENREDAMLATIEIVGFVHCLLNQVQQSILTFIGRELDGCCVREVEHKWDKKIPHEYIFETGNNIQKGVGVNKRQRFDVANPLYFFLSECLPGFDCNMLTILPEDTWLLVVALVYYIRKTNKDFVYAAYSVLLSYVMLGPVSENVGLIKRSNFLATLPTPETESGKQGLTHQDCVSASNILMEMFYVEDVKTKFDRTTFHGFSEFQHCLQHLNYLNMFCGEDMKCTVFHKCYNGTFVYNVFHLIKDKEDAVEYLGKMLKHSSVFALFKNIVDVFHKCLSSVRDQ